MPFSVMVTNWPASTWVVVPLSVWLVFTSAPSIISLPANTLMLRVGRSSGLASIVTVWVTVVVLPAASLKVVVNG
ncbi:hypothetical protein D3C80_1331250 [compost metagenome]